MKRTCNTFDDQLSSGTVDKVIVFETEGHWFKSVRRQLTSPLDRPLLAAAHFLKLVYTVISLLK